MAEGSEQSVVCNEEGRGRRVGERRKISLAGTHMGHSLQIRNDRKTRLRTQSHQKYCGMHQSTSSDAEVIFPALCCTIY